MWSAAVLPPGDQQSEVSSEVSRWQFLRGLRTSRLLSAEDVELVERELQSTPLEEVQQMLVDQGALTEYQLRRLCDGRGAGLVLAQYRILDEIGGGGFGQVYKASHSVMNRVVALKIMTPDYGHNRLFREVFSREVAAVTRLNHPNVVLTFDANEIDGTLFMAMEHVEGPTLHTFVTNNGPPPLPLAAAIMSQIAAGVRHAHETGLVHRDLKPANVLVQEVPRVGAEPPSVLVKVIDFGLARLHERGGGSTGTLLADPGAVVGTPAFMAPEQAVNFHDADARSDLYSLGCTFYFLLTGRLPFESTSSRNVIEMHANKVVRPLRELRPEVSIGLAALVHRLMAKSPDDRYQTADELCEALDMLAPYIADPCDDAWGGPGPIGDLPNLDWAEAERTPVTIPCLGRTGELNGDPGGDTPAAPPHAHQGGAQWPRLWREWCVVMESQVRGEEPLISAARYADLYRALVPSLRAVGDAGAVPMRLRTVVEPWVTLRAFQSLDRDTAEQLWQTCQELDAAIVPREARRAVNMGQPLLTLGTLAALVAGGAYAAMNWPRLAALVTGGS